VVLYERPLSPVVSDIRWTSAVAKRISARRSFFPLPLGQVRICQSFLMDGLREG